MSSNISLILQIPRLSIFLMVLAALISEEENEISLTRKDCVIRMMMMTVEFTIGPFLDLNQMEETLRQQ